MAADGAGGPFGPRIRRALVSVSDKSGLIELGRSLAALDVEIISTGGTARQLREAGVAVRPIDEVTGYPEMLGGRVRTLHPKIHGAILGDREDPEHRRTMSEHGIGEIDLVVVNLYPFERALSERLGEEQARELIDIGGPCLLRAAAKNAKQVAPVPTPSLYPEILDELRRSRGFLSLATRERLRRETFLRTGAYDAIISRYLAEEGSADAVPDPLPLFLSGALALRYGENPHQSAELFPLAGSGGAEHRVLGGRALSFNNLVDLDAAARLVQSVEETAVAIVKHTNPCGAATGATPLEAFRRALECDRVSAFGGIVGCNRPVDAPLASALSEIFLEAVIAPAFEGEATDVLTRKKNLRLVELPALSEHARALPPSHEICSTLFGLLVQTADGPDPTEAWRVGAGEEPRGALLADARFAWHVARHVKSNAIVLVKEGRTIGVGAGQMNRVDSVRIAVDNARRAGLDPDGSVLASDAFFPFADGVEQACAAGVKVIVQPGGSIRDEEVVLAAKQAGAAMLLTGRRHFKH